MDERETEIANALNMLVDANLGRAHSSVELRQLVEDYFCSNDDDDGGAADFHDGDEDTESDDGTPADSPCIVDEATPVLERASELFICEESADEMEKIRLFKCQCKLNSGKPCYSSFTVDEILRRRMDMMELTSGKLCAIMF